MKILTPSGFQDFKGIIKKKGQCLKVSFTDGTDIICSIDHKFESSGKEIVASSLKTCDTIGDKVVKGITCVGGRDVYSPLMVEGRSQVYFQWSCPS